MLLDRFAERAALAGLLDAARTGQSGVLVLRGEPGVGKTALLEDAIASAAGLRVARVAGVESEMELAFAALQQLCSSAARPSPTTCGKCSSSSASPRATSSSASSPAEAIARPAIRLAIHWPVTTIDPDGCALKRTGSSVLVVPGIRRQRARH
jgi:hypothetical protein